MRFDRESFYAIAPFAAWILLMTLLPASAGSYALRSACAVALALPLLPRLLNQSKAVYARSLMFGVPAGLLVLVLWIAPERFEWYREWMVVGGMSAEPSPYEPTLAGWPLVIAKLIGSAFVIAPIEELFFRNYLYRRLQDRQWQAVSPSRFDASAFFWTVALFALEHNRIVVAALAGAIYSAAAIRHGIGAAIVAHITTNFALGLWVICRGDWAFW